MSSAKISSVLWIVKWLQLHHLTGNGTTGFGNGAKLNYNFQTCTFEFWHVPAKGASSTEGWQQKLISNLTKQQAKSEAWSFFLVWLVWFFTSLPLASSLFRFHVSVSALKFSFLLVRFLLRQLLYNQSFTIIFRDTPLQEEYNFDVTVNTILYIRSTEFIAHTWKIL